MLCGLWGNEKLKTEMEQTRRCVGELRQYDCVQSVPLYGTHEAHVSRRFKSPFKILLLCFR